MTEAKALALLYNDRAIAATLAYLSKVTDGDQGKRARTSAEDQALIEYAMVLRASAAAAEATDYLTGVIQ